MRLTDQEIGLIISALQARCSGVSAKRRETLERLLQRLAEMNPGNPYWRLGWPERPMPGLPRAATAVAQGREYRSTGRPQAEGSAGDEVYAGRQSPPSAP